MTEIKLNLENLTDAERKKLMWLVEKANKPKSEVWKPEYGKQYWYIGWAGYVQSGAWLNNSDQKDTYAIGNCFRTREEAEEEVTRRKMLKRWKDFSILSGEDDNPWDGTSKHYCACLNEEDNVRVAYVMCVHDANTFFATRKACEEAVEELGEENVKKYILGVKE